MPINYDGRLELKFYYTVTPAGLLAFQHTHTIDFQPQEISEVEPGALFDQIVTLWHNGSTSQTLDADVDAYAALIAPFLDAAEAEISVVELWKYPAEPSDNPQLVSVYELALAGGNAGAPLIAGQMTMTFTTQGGNPMRVQIMEPDGANAFVQQTPPFTPASAAADLAAYLTGTAHPFVGRDNTRPLAARKLSFTTNEKLYNKRFRSA